MSVVNLAHLLPKLQLWDLTDYRVLRLGYFQKSCSGAFAKYSQCVFKDPFIFHAGRQSRMIMNANASSWKSQRTVLFSPSLKFHVHFWMNDVWHLEGPSCKGASVLCQLASSQWGFLANFPCSQDKVSAGVLSMPPFSWQWLLLPFSSHHFDPLVGSCLHLYWLTGTKALKLQYCGPLATHDWSRGWHMT